MNRSNKLLDHSAIGVQVRVCVHLLWWVWHALNALNRDLRAPVHIQMCTLHRCRSTPVYIFVTTLSAGCAHPLVRQDKILDQLLYSLKRIFREKKPNTENSNPDGFELHRPFIKGIRLLFKVLKVSISITHTHTHTHMHTVSHTRRETETETRHRQRHRQRHTYKALKLDNHNRTTLVTSFLSEIKWRQGRGKI